MQSTTSTMDSTTTNVMNEGYAIEDLDEELRQRLEELIADMLNCLGGPFKTGLVPLVEGMERGEDMSIEDICDALWLSVKAAAAELKRVEKMADESIREHDTSMVEMKNLQQVHDKTMSELTKLKRAIMDKDRTIISNSTDARDAYERLSHKYKNIEEKFEKEMVSSQKLRAQHTKNEEINISRIKELEDELLIKTNELADSESSLDKATTSLETALVDIEMLKIEMAEKDDKMDVMKQKLREATWSLEKGKESRNIEKDKITQAINGVTMAKNKVIQKLELDVKASRVETNTVRVENERILASTRRVLKAHKDALEEEKRVAGMNLQEVERLLEGL